jgi:hypothetical protein
VPPALSGLKTQGGYDTRADAPGKHPPHYLRGNVAEFSYGENNSR